MECFSIYETYYELDIWIYPFLGRFDEPYRMLFVLALFLTFSVTSLAFNLVNNLYCIEIKPHFREYTNVSFELETTTLNFGNILYSYVRVRTIFE